MKSAEDLISPLSPTGDGGGLSSAQLTTRSVSSWSSLVMPTKSLASPSKLCCEIPWCPHSGSYQGIYFCITIFLAPTFKTCFSTDIWGHTMRTQPANAAPGSTPAMSPCPSCACSYQLEGVYRHVKEKTDFSEHPVNAGKKEQKGNWRSNLGRRREKQETMAQRRELTTPSALPLSI